jgi:hypothetical protein
LKACFFTWKSSSITKIQKELGVEIFHRQAGIEGCGRPDRASVLAVNVLLSEEIRGAGCQS